MEKQDLIGKKVKLEGDDRIYTVVEYACAYFPYKLVHPTNIETARRSQFTVLEEEYTKINKHE